MELSSEDKGKLIRKVSKVSGINQSIIKAKMTDEQILAASEQLEILKIFRDIKENVELTQNKFGCKYCDNNVRMIILSERVEPTWCKYDAYYIAYYKFLECPVCNNINVLKEDGDSGAFNYDQYGEIYWDSSCITLRLTKIALKEEVADELKETKLQSPNIAKTIRLIEEFIEDPNLQNYLLQILKELEIAVEAQLHLSSIVLCASILEAILCQILKEQKSKRLHDLIETAISRNILDENSKKFVTQIKEYRNTLHYENWKKSGLRFEEKTAAIIVHSLELTSKSLIEALSSKQISL